MNAAPRSPWALARTVIAASGLGFVGVALGSACLDYAGEGFGACPVGGSTVAASTGAGSGTAEGPLKAGSGVGNGAPASASGMDCGTTAPSAPDAAAVGSGSAAP
ncbi:MAG: hypothetical protein ABJE95_08960 [Byssovorax sp.]